MFKSLSVSLMVTFFITFIQPMQADEITLQQGLNEYMGCQDIHIGNGDSNFTPECNNSQHPALYTEEAIG